MKRMTVAQRRRSSAMLWGGRFTEALNTDMDILNKSIDVDKRMWAVDIKGSIAYAKALYQADLLSQEECQNLLDGLYSVQQEWEEETFIVVSTDEDIHTAIERRLKELTGSSVGGKIHTGRSRNDQVVTDMKLWMMEHVPSLRELLLRVIGAISRRAIENIDVMMPGYTHMQQAQPVRWSHWILSYAWSFQQDVERLDDVIKRLDHLPLGSGALAGNPFPIDRDYLATELGFTKCTPNSMYAVSDRDFIVDFLSWASLVAVHLSRLAEDLILYNSKEFNFITVSEAYSTGSSLMPHKKNPDGLECIRGKAARIIGDYNALLVVLKGLPSTYNKDLQEDKDILFHTYDTMEILLKVARGNIDTLKVNSNACYRALSPDMLATDVAYYLVHKGVAFRDAHEIAGRVVARAETKGKPITELSLSGLRKISPAFTEDISNVWNYEHSVEQYKAKGGTSKQAVIDQIEKLNYWLSVRKAAAEEAAAAAAATEETED